MSFPFFRNGKLLFCNGGPAAECCPDQSDSSSSSSSSPTVHVCVIQVSSVNMAANDCFIARNVYVNGSALGACNADSWSFTFTENTAVELRAFMMAWDVGQQQYPLSAYSVDWRFAVDGGAWQTANINMGDSGTSSAHTGCETPSNSGKFVFNVIA